MLGFEAPDPRGESVGGGKAFDLISKAVEPGNARREAHLLFGALRTTEGYRVAMSYVEDGLIVDTKYGADQLKHHCLSMMESLIAQYLIDSYNEPLKFFETAQMR
jgi:hypothetical protein